MRYSCIILAWKDFERLGEEEIEKRLDNFVFCIRTGYMVLDKYKENYIPFYLFHKNYDLSKMTGLETFFEAIKRESPEGYKFLSNGHDIINLNKYLAFKQESYENIQKKYKDLLGLSEFIRYSFLKIMREKNEEKKESLLLGILGLKS